MRYGFFATCSSFGFALALGCGGDAPTEGGGATGMGIDTISGTAPETEAGSGTTDPTVASMTGTGSTTDTPTTDTPSGSGTVADDSTSTGGESSSSGAGDESTTTGREQGCEPQGEQVVEFSYIWVANSSDGTISKIDTDSGVELGRYIVRPDRNGNPSRTSVNRYGDVVVANRSGGITKVFASVEDCQESNGMPGIQTSSGPGDVLDWGIEECIAWHTEINHDNNRPVAWQNGVLNEETCEFEGVNLYTAYLDTGVDGTVEIAQLDGDNGMVIDTIPMPEIARLTHGFYGAAIDTEDNAWFSQLQGGQLVRVNAADNSVDTWDVGDNYGYGITVADGYVWVCGRGTHRFDPVAETWDTVQTIDPGAYIHTGGCMGDGAGVLYRGTHDRVVGIDTNTLATTVELTAQLAGDDYIWGVAVDFDGFVWAIPRNATHAYKLDPANPANPLVLTVEGLINSYTYSDMTGFSLFSVLPG